MLFVPSNLHTRELGQEIHDDVDLMRYVLSKTMKRVAVTRRGKKKRDQPSSSNAIEDAGFDEPIGAICDALPNTQLSTVPKIMTAPFTHS